MSGHKTFDGWQPIETAPKGANGITFMMLAFGPPGDQTISEGMHHQGRFYAASVFHVGGPHGERQFAFREHEVHPTHWRPTPAPPLAPAETASERERLVEENRSLRNALAEIADRHIPDQPAAAGGDELSWAQRQHGALRAIARAALAAPSPQPVDAVREALEPFRKMVIWEHIDDDASLTNPRETGVRISAGHVRRLAAALAQEPAR